MAEYVMYVPHLRRGYFRQDAPALGFYRVSWRCSRLLAHRRFRGHLVECGAELEKRFPPIKDIQKRIK